MMEITGLSHLFKLENLHNWCLTKYFFAPLYAWYRRHVSGRKLRFRFSCMCHTFPVSFSTQTVLLMFLCLCNSFRSVS